MKRKKWSEKEEQTLLTKYSELQNNGTLSKMKTREKKYKPIAEHVNTVHNSQDPVSYPFKWSWRDVSVKVQNMRHQYLGVKQKIKVNDNEFNWDDGEHHWENFIMYRDVFGDVREVSVGGGVGGKDCIFGGGFGDLGFELGGFGGSSEEEESGGSSEEGEEEEERESGKRRRVGARVVELRDVLVKREERRREREFEREERGEGGREEGLGEERERERENEMEEMEMRWARREFERREREEREREEERRWRRKAEERREEEDMEWRERMLVLQIEHEKQMMQMFADACQNQMQVLGVMARFMCQFFGSASDGLGGGLGGLPPQVLQNLQHPGPGDLGDNCKPESSSPPEFM